MSKKKMLVFFCLCIVIRAVLSEEVQFRILEDTPAWMSWTAWTFDSPKTDVAADIIIPKGSLISDVSMPSPGRINGTKSFIHSVVFENARYYIVANSFAPVDTEELFRKPFLTDIDWQTEIWMNSYFLAVLKNGDRNILMPYEQRIVDEYERDYESPYWFEVASTFKYSLVITQGTISMGGLATDEFWIKRLERIPNGYRVTVTWNTYSDSYATKETPNRIRSMAVNLPPREEAPVFDLYFIADGDYLDVYYSVEPDGSDRIFSTSFALTDSEMGKQIGGIVQHGVLADVPVPYYPERLTFWPRRADGSMDFPPPEGANLAFRPSHKTTDRLRVRDNPDTGSAIVTTLDTGTGVQVLETGATETIGGITAPWVKVLAENGFTGWAFSGYLETLNLETQNQESTNKEPENVETQNETGEASLLGDSAAPNRHPLNQGQNPETVNQKSGFPVLPFAITGGVILVAGIAAIAVFAKRKKG